MNLFEKITSEPNYTNLFKTRKHFFDLNTKDFNVYYNGSKVVMGEVFKSDQDTLWVRVKGLTILDGDSDLIRIDSEEKLMLLAIIPIAKAITTKKKALLN